MSLSTVLVANRGEIARRVIRTLRARGMRSVAVHSSVDAAAPHVREADAAVALPGDPVAAYLDVEAVVAAAVTSGAEAIHPGYGFLSENPRLPEACAAAGITFVGPSAEVIALMGDKAASKHEAAAAGVPVLQSIDPAGLDAASLRAEVQRLGLPVIVKAVAGGGGKGMRRVDALDDLPDAVAAAGREGAAAFGDDRLLVERWVPASRHVEIQVAGDHHGGAVHLFERDCSIQRRHQKIVEEAPSPALDPALRERMGAAAVALVRRVGYVNLGTVEFLLDTSGDGEEFFFLEMNTRLQVEHPVTEAVTGLDLVGCQLDIAAGGRVPRVPDGPAGHAIEVRLYAEDVAAGFLPQAGNVRHFHVGDGVRVDSGVEPGSEVSSFYDPMLAKVIAHGPDREAARQRLLAALSDSRVTGVVTNLDHLRAILASPAFASGDFTTGFLARHLPDWQPDPVDEVTLVAAAAALAATDGTGDPPASRSWPHGAQVDPWRLLGPWRSGGVGGWAVALGDDPQESTVLRVTTTDAGWAVATGSGTRAVSRVRGPDSAGVLVLSVDGDELTAAAHRDGAHVWIARSGHGSRRLAAPRAVRHVEGALLHGDAGLVAPMPGQVVEVRVAEGDEVAAGDTLVVVEAMKMEHPVVAPGSGVVTKVNAVVGDGVRADEVLVVVHGDDADARDADVDVDEEAAGVA